jgi:hypothetical protein
MLRKVRMHLAVACCRDEVTVMMVIEGVHRHHRKGMFRCINNSTFALACDPPYSAQDLLCGLEGIKLYL